MIFKHYAELHQPIQNVSTTFEKMTKIHATMIISDFVKFCKDFELPVTKKDQMEVFRKIAVKTNIKEIQFDTFVDILKELFFVKETE